MSTLCEICDQTSKYKCPKCLIRYCSVDCFKVHKEKCAETSSSQSQNVQDKVESSDVQAIDLHLLNLNSKDTVPGKSLEMLKESVDVQHLLQNPDLRERLMRLTCCSDGDESENLMKELMKEKPFRDFANACMKIVCPETNTFEPDDEFTS